MEELNLLWVCVCVALLVRSYDRRTDAKFLGVGISSNFKPATFKIPVETITYNRIGRRADNTVQYIRYGSLSKVDSQRSGHYLFN